MPTEDTTSAPAGANLVDPSASIEDLARAMGWWTPLGVARWGLDVHEDGYFLTDWCTASPCDGWPLSASEALLLLHLARLGPTRERCKDCEGGRQSMSRGDMSAAITKGEYASVGACARAGWNFDTSVSVGSGSWPGLSRPCPTCTGPGRECEVCEGSGIDPENPGGQNASWANPYGDPPEQCLCDGGTVPGKPTGWLTREHGWAERWLRARPQECHGCPACDGTIDDDGPRCVGLARPGDPEAHADLEVLADQLQDQGDPLGDWLALWLPCHGTGLGLGHHTQAMAARGAA